jgi:hypothetical protein
MWELDFPREADCTPSVLLAPAMRDPRAVRLDLEVLDLLVDLVPLALELVE